MQSGWLPNFLVEEEGVAHIEAANPILRMVVLGVGALSVLFILAGLVLVLVGATGDTEITLFGNAFKSQNVGIASIFCGAVVMVAIGRRVLTALERLGKI
jgi:hypothetical protein